MPHRTCPSTSIPSTSSGSRKRSEENGKQRAGVGIRERPRGGGEDADDLRLLEPPRGVGRDAPEKGVHEPAGLARRERRQRRDDLDRLGIEADLLVGLSQGRREEVGVTGLRLPSGKPELTAVLSSVVGPHHEHDPHLVVRVPVHRHQHRRRAQIVAHALSCRRRSSIVSRDRTTRTEPSRTRTAAGRGTPL